MQRTSTTRLPAALREQIDQELGNSIHRRSKQTVNRKQVRKQERQQHKQRKADFFSQTKSASPQLQSKSSRKRSAPEDDRPNEGSLRKKPRNASDPSSIPEKVTLRRSNPSTVTSSQDGHAIPKKEPVQKATIKSKTISRPSDRDPPKKAVNSIPREEDAEDRQIAWLESKLGMAKNKSGKKKKSAFGDGLDGLFDDLDRIIPTTSQTSVLATQSGSGAEEDSNLSEFEGFSTAGDEYLEDEREHLADSRINISDSRIAHSEPTVEQDEVMERPGVSKHLSATSTPSGSRYIPPHLRPRSTENSESLAKLSRQLKGLFNRLSEHNMTSILMSIEELYRNHRRNDMTSTVTDLVIDGISSHSSLLDSFVVLHASLVASLYKIIGVDFAAHFVQRLVASYEQNYQTLQATEASDGVDDEPKGKECLNLVVLLSELYNFQVISCVLVYDVIRGLLDRLDEFDVELLLKIARNSGQQLRQDDPSALKDIIQIVQAKMSEKEQPMISSRTSFMVETLTNLKNNKVKRTVGQDGHSESTDRMKRFLSGLSKKHHILAHEPLRVTLEDLHSSEKKGKWWLVGSAWGGDPLLDRTQEDRQPVTMDPPQRGANNLMELARKQGMNTDVRRSVFVVLMSSDDYVDACQRLSQLNLTEVQQREIVRVILHCLGNEKLYNPYYTLVVQELCRTSHSYKVTLQFCLWDFLRDLGEKGVGGLEIVKNLQDGDSHVAFDGNKKISSTSSINVARAYAWWLAKGCSSLTILKPVDFTILQPRSREFFRTLFFHLFISSQVSSPAIAPNEGAAEHLTGTRNRESLEEVFIKATRVPALAQGLVYCLTNVLRGDNGSNSEVVSETLKWARGVAKDTLRTGMDVLATLT